jgi:hypothetical protein
MLDYDGRMMASVERVCPLCQGVLRREDIQKFRLDCPHCSKGLRACFFRGYDEVKFFTCVGAGLALAWYRWHGSFGIFVSGFYIILFRFLWDLIERRFFLPNKFVPAPPWFYTFRLRSR